MIRSVLKLKPLVISNKKVYSKKNNIVLNAITENKNEIIDKMNYQFLNFIETINGRCAMQGFIWGMKNGIETNKNILEQVMIKNSEGNYYNGENIEHILEAVIIIGLIAFGTTVSTLNYDTPIVTISMKNSPNHFTKTNERLNGRLAMIGFLILCVI
tara:strand:+ start:377 stop:847 length:471 start_codon:yes stop_codon:yes gene_type:complete